MTSPVVSKRMRFAGATATVDSVSALLEEEAIGEPQGSLDRIPVAQIVFDPDQPRRLHLSRTNPGEIDDRAVDAESQRAELEPLRELADSIRQHGVIQAIGVYRHGHQYRLIWGERRVLASMLAQQETVLARIFPERPRNVRAQQLIENVLRQDLSLSERVRGVRQLIDERRTSGEPLQSAAALGKEVGWSTSHAYAYWGIAQGPDDVVTAVDEGILTDVKLAYAISALASASERAAAIERARDGNARVLREKSTEKPEMRKEPRRGRPMVAITLGKTKSPYVARYIAERLLDAREFAPFKDADWTDMKTAADILRQVLKRIEQQVLKPS